jgi:hypothetical protein
MHKFTPEESISTVAALNATKSREPIQFIYHKDIQPEWKDYPYDLPGLSPLEIISSGGVLRPTPKVVLRPITWKELDFSKCIWVAQPGHVPRLVVGTDISSGNGGRLMVMNLSSHPNQVNKVEDLYINTLAKDGAYYSYINTTYLGNSIGLYGSFQPPLDGSWKPFMVTETIPVTK